MLQLRCKAQLFVSEERLCEVIYVVKQTDDTKHIFKHVESDNNSDKHQIERNSCKKILCVFTDKQRSDSASSFSRAIRNWFVMPI